MRIRTIKPEFFTHEGLFEAEKETGFPLRVAFPGLWCAADREGRFKWEPRRLKSLILPYDEINFSNVLDSLERHGFIVRYGENMEFGVIPSFLDHQCVNAREAQSKLSAPDCNAHSNPVHACAKKEHVPNGINIPIPLRETVFDRDQRKCGRCSSYEDLTIDHIFPQCICGNHAISNLRTLCRKCNSARPVAGKGLMDDLALDGLTLNDMQRMCMHVNARVEGKGRERNMEGKGMRETSPPVSIPESLSSIPGFNEEWKNFVDHRKSKGKMTDRAKELILQTLAERPLESIRAMQEAITRGWSGIKWDWLDRTFSNAATVKQGKAKGEYALTDAEQPKSWNPLTDE